MAFDFISVRSMFEGVSYFHGNLSPTEANFRLNRRGCYNGLYLIYEDIEIPGKYILAICSEDRIRTYYLGISSDGNITYGDGVTAPLMHPHELIHYHLQKCKEFPVRPLVPCMRPSENDEKPMAWQTVSMEELEIRMLDYAENFSSTSPSEVLRSKRKEYITNVARQMHTYQAWYHGAIDREEAERRLSSLGKLSSGKFLIRTKDDGSFAMSLCYKNEFRHYTIKRMNTDDGELFALDDEPALSSIMDIVEHYSAKPKSFVLALKTQCAREGFTKTEIPSIMEKSQKALESYVEETFHIQNPRKITEKGHKNNIANTENLVAVTNVERHQLEVKEKANQPQNAAEDSGTAIDEDDAKLDAFIASVVPLNDDLIVTKVFAI